MTALDRHRPAMPDAAPLGSGPADRRPPKGGDRTARFWDRAADKYARKPVADEAAYRRKLEITQGYLRPEMEVLEFGCGTGSTALAHAPFVRRILAVDLSARMIEIARQKADAAGVRNVEFARSAIEELDGPDHAYDAVLGLSILHLLEDRGAAIAKVHRLLKPGGVFVSSTVCIAEMSPIFRIVLPVGRAFGLVPTVGIFRAADLRADLERTGFAIEHDWQPGKGKAVFIVARKGRSGA